MRIILKDWRLPVAAVPPEQVNPDHHLHDRLAQTLRIAPAELKSYRIVQKSIDARRKGQPLLIYVIEAAVAVKPPDGEWTELTDEAPEPAYDVKSVGRQDIPMHPIVVGTGPAGLAAAWVLARQGLKPLVIDRGQPVEQRTRDLETFFATRELNPESNFLFGEGGAGTYSDGKLYTRIRDEHARQVLQLFTAAGAPPEILYLKRPHIGSDILPVMVKNIRQKIEALGGTFRWNTEVTGINQKNGRCCGVVLKSGEEITAPAVFLGFGHSARELINNLRRSGVAHALKGFQTGCRIEHPQLLIDRNQYGLATRPACLGAAEYNMVSKVPQGGAVPGVSSFCMCPGGEIVPATAVPGRLSTNGMSCYRRNGEFANACLIMSWHPEDFKDADDAFAFLDRLEEATFVAGGGDYTAPAQDAAAFLRGEKKLSLSTGSYRLGMTAARLDTMLPGRMTAALREALVQFDRQCRGFVSQGKLVGLETHVSSPVRFLRDGDRSVSSLAGLYIMGEGAGCAGGIVSAAVDGWRAAEEYWQSGA